MQTVATKKLKQSQLQTDVANMESIVCFVVTNNGQSGPVAEKMRIIISLSYFCLLGQIRVSIEYHHCVIIFDTKPAASYLQQQDT